MIKRLALLALLVGIPSAGWAGTASTNLTVQINPVPTAPPVAAAAGFTTLGYRWDFSQPLYATLANWYDCSGTNFSNPAQLLHQGAPGIQLNNPCSISQTNDGGINVIDFHWDTSYDNTWGAQFGNGNFNGVGGQTADQNGNVSIDFPSMYIETVARVTRTFGQPANSGGPNDVWTWGDPPGCSIEIDVFELYEDQGGFADGSAHSWCTGTDAYRWYSYSDPNHLLPPGYAVTDYHKYGTLLTSDGSTEIYVCGFVDDRLQGCGGVNAASNTASFTTRNRINIGVSSNLGTAAANIDLNIKYVAVYTCSAWKTSMCNGSTLFNSGGLIYWH